MAQGHSTLINYYLCGFSLLPSHLLGMSRWISAEDYCASSSSLSSSQTKANKQRQEMTKSGDILRRFRYSYYWGLIQVDTRHVCVDDVAECDGTTQRKFLLEEFFDSSITMRTTFYTVFGLFVSIVGYCMRVYRGGSNSQISSLLSGFLVLVVVRLILILTGVKNSPVRKSKKWRVIEGLYDQKSQKLARRKILQLDCPNSEMSQTTVASSR